MTVQASPSRPASKSVGAAFVGILLTLSIFAVVMLSFLIAPLVVLLGAYLAFLMFRSRKKRDAAAPVDGAHPAIGPGAQAPRPTHGFGTGASS